MGSFQLSRGGDGEVGPAIENGNHSASLAKEITEHRRQQTNTIARLKEIVAALPAEEVTLGGGGGGKRGGGVAPGVSTVLPGGCRVARRRK